jgi:hypothetical protein
MDMVVGRPGRDAGDPAADVGASGCSRFIKDYLAVNFGRGWVTPFDPRTHVRHADFAAWKEYRVTRWAYDDHPRTHVRHADFAWASFSSSTSRQ